MSPSAITARELYHSVGVNVHTYYGDTPSADFPRVTAALKDIGIRHVRASVLAPQDTRSQLSIAGAKALYSAGIRLLSNFSGPPGHGDNQGVGAFTPLDILNLFNSGQLPADMIDCWQGPNEPDGDPSYSAIDLVNWYNVIGWDLVVGNSAKVTRRLIGPAFTGPVANGAVFKQAGANLAVINASDCHPYRGGTTPWAGALDAVQSVNDAWVPRGSVPMYASECGYTYGPRGTMGQPPVSEAVGAEYTLRTLLVHAAYGVVETYLYHLIDDWAPTSTASDQFFYGLYRHDWTPRTVVAALKNFLTIVGDADVPAGGHAPEFSARVAGFQPGPSDEFGIPDQLQTLVVAPAVDRPLQVWVWRTVSIWDRANYAPRTPNTQQLTLSVPGVTLTRARICYPMDFEHGDEGPAWHDLAPGSTGVPFEIAGNCCVIAI